MQLIKFTRVDNSSVYINPEHVVRVMPAEKTGKPSDGLRVTQIDTLEGSQVVREDLRTVVTALGSTA